MTNTLQLGAPDPTGFFTIRLLRDPPPIRIGSC